MLEDDDELANLLADEDRVRDALLAAVDGQQVPPVHTNLGDIVRRGRRRARLQVVGASVAAVVLIGAVALGATLLGRLGSPDRTSAAGPGTSLPMTSQTVTTSPNTPPTSANQDLYQPDVACVFPAIVGTAKWVPLSKAQLDVFAARTAALQRGSSGKVIPALPAKLGDEGRLASQSIEVDWHGQQTLVTVSASYYGGNPMMAIVEDEKNQRMPRDCAGASAEHQIDKTMLVVEYPATSMSTTGPTYLRVALYAQGGIRYDVTEAVSAVSADSPPAPSTQAETAPSAQTAQSSGFMVPASRATPAGLGWPPALSINQLLDVAIGVASTP